MRLRYGTRQSEHLPETSVITEGKNYFVDGSENETKKCAFSCARAGGAKVLHPTFPCINGSRVQEYTDALIWAVPVGKIPAFVKKLRQTGKGITAIYDLQGAKSC